MFFKAQFWDWFSHTNNQEGVARPAAYFSAPDWGAVSSSNCKYQTFFFLWWSSHNIANQKSDREASATGCCVLCAAKCKSGNSIVFSVNISPVFLISFLVLWVQNTTQPRAASLQHWSSSLFVFPLQSRLITRLSVRSHVRRIATVGLEYKGQGYIAGSSDSWSFSVWAAIASVTWMPCYVFSTFMTTNSSNGFIALTLLIKTQLM